MTQNDFDQAPPPIQLLVTLAGRLGAIFTPPRRPNDADWAHRWQAIWAYRQGLGMPYGSGAAANTEAQRAARALSELVKAGLVKRHRTKGSKTLSVTLTGTGLQIAWALCGLPGVKESIETTVRLYGFRNHPESEFRERPGPDYDPLRPWVPEIAFIGKLDGRKINDWSDIPPHHHPSAILQVQESLRPCYALGLIDFNSDADRRVWVSLTPAGLSVALGEDQLEIHQDLPEVVDGAIHAYDAAFDSALADLCSRDERINDIGRCPLSCSIFTRRAARKEGIAV